MRYGIGLYDHAMGGAVAESVADRHAVRMKAVRGNLELPDHTPAQVAQKFQRGFGVPLADAPADNGLLCSGHADENILIALSENLMAQDILLLLADDPPIIDPIIEGLLKRLPKSGDVWPEAERKLWLQLLEGSFKLIYKDKTLPPSPELPPLPS
jgi:hypothetical protein